MTLEALFPYMAAEMHFTRGEWRLSISLILTGQHYNKITVEAWSFASRIEFYELYVLAVVLVVCH